MVVNIYVSLTIDINMSSIRWLYLCFGIRIKCYFIGFSLYSSSVTPFIPVVDNLHVVCSLSICYWVRFMVLVIDIIRGNIRFRFDKSKQSTSWEKKKKTDEGKPECKNRSAINCVIVWLFLPHPLPSVFLFQHSFPSISNKTLSLEENELEWEREKEREIKGGKGGRREKTTRFNWVVQIVHSNRYTFRHIHSQTHYPQYTLKQTMKRNENKLQ